jgi:hypothetical protein
MPGSKAFSTKMALNPPWLFIFNALHLYDFYISEANGHMLSS